MRIDYDLLVEYRKLKPNSSMLAALGPDGKAMPCNFRTGCPEAAHELSCGRCPLGLACLPELKEDIRKCE